MRSVIFRILIIVTFLVSASGCTSEKADISTQGSCISCHVMATDNNHNMKCVGCHKGIDTLDEKGRAHQGLVKFPASPDNLQLYCVPCHESVIPATIKSLHFTLNNSSNTFRKAFGAKNTLSSFTKTPIVNTPSTNIELVDNLLRQRCYKCHLYDSGQDYPLTSHGQGCGGCHFVAEDSENTPHIFSSPTDDHCLSCHYGNYVGFDYYGRFEHDFNDEYRTPYTTSNEYFRPYGVEYRQLSSDIHHQKGLLCIDCHSGNELMLSKKKPSCGGCHDKSQLQKSLPERIIIENGDFILLSSRGTKHPIPLLTHPAHFNQSETPSCQVCHSQWSFDDRGRNFLRIDSDEIDNFSALTVQGNHEIETILVNNFDYDKQELPFAMTDTLTGRSSSGIWIKGYLERRWHEVRLGRDRSGQIVVVRPILDYSLSWIDKDENVIFDAIQPVDASSYLQAYTPHTTGRAGLFYQARIQQFLKQEKQSTTSLEVISSADVH